ncbi:MAG TPA: diguanylate cyclase [Pyrinomonadaceae bacterium]|nr:diguanylate cyclase [Pyrinomonadaceae bacterium]
MEDLANNKSGWHSKAFWGAGICVAGMILLLAAAEAWTFSFSRIITLILSGFTAVLVGQYRARIPRTRFIFPTANAFAFWGIIWIGLPGGVLLGTLAALAGIGSWRRVTLKRLGRAAGYIIATFFSAAAYFWVLGRVGSLEPATIGGLNIPRDIIVASVFMALTHFAQLGALNYLAQVIVPDDADRGFREILALPAIAHSISLVATVVLFLTFNHFGIEFGFVILLAAVIGHMVYKIHSRALESKTKQIRDSSRMHLATVEALAMAIDARDQVGIGHVRRTQFYAVGIGKVLGLSEGEIDAIRTGALLHDIGKLGIPDHILSKPGRLTAGEMEKMKTHAVIGAAILEKIDFPYDVVPMVRHHHETWNGKGYPDGLRGNTIPITARILRVADSYDTMRGARHYRPAVSRNEARGLLRAGSGTEFDPKIVDVFLKNLSAFEEEIEAQELSYEAEIEERNPLHESAGDETSFVEHIQKANREVFTLYSLARDFSSAHTLNETLSLFTEKVGEIVPFSTCLVHLMDDSKEFATAVHVDGANRAALLGKRVNVGEGATGYVLKKSRSVENVDPALDFAFSHTELGGEYLAMVSIPLLVGENLIGAITLYSSELPVYGDEHIRLLETVTKIATDAIAKSQRHAEIQSHAFTDPMTGLPNARSLQAQFEKEVKRSSRNGSVFQMLVLDLDGFKAVNDNYGHKAGDNMLKLIGAVIRDQLREYDFLSRYGGDEFVAIVPDTQSTDVLELCQRIENAVSEFKLAVGENMTASVGVSIGAACYPHQGETFDQIVVAADKAMYRNKEFHRKRDSLREELSNSGAFRVVVEPEIIQNPLQINEDKLPGYVVVGTSEDEGLIIEIDDIHISTSSAVN